MALTIGETVAKLHAALREYIEATYHVSHSAIVAQRRDLLDKRGVIHQQPYLESTPRYQLGMAFKDLELPDSVVEMFSTVTSSSKTLPRLIYDPPYQHQATSVKKNLSDKRSLVVMTGTGSGKTECFLLPILGKLAIEAHEHRERFQSTAAVRALVLYPMNALVNDQLGRLRQFFGDPRIVEKFSQWSGRPARFARYTSRTLYPGIRNVKKDQDRLKAIGHYFVKHLESAEDPDSPNHKKSAQLVDDLKKRGKWPAKPDLLAWYGKKNTPWRDRKTNEFKRCITLPQDSELLTRHEVQEAPPDVLVTNYSMLEYMLMRPLERPIFDATRDWLHDNQDESFLLVIDEAHLYRGAAGAEVALLIRRLRSRLEISPERLQIICTSASFQDKDYAAEFGAQLTGKEKTDFETVAGDLDLRESEGKGSQGDIDALCKIDLAAFYNAENDQDRLTHVMSFLEYRNVEKQSTLGESLYKALENYPPLGRLINMTMRSAQPLAKLESELFENVDAETTGSAVTALIALGSLARPEQNSPGLLPCRVHSFYRGLAGLWACMNPDCSELEPKQQGGPCGKLYSQPTDKCDCGARVLELYTCRDCGTAYARAYTDDLDQPNYLWSTAGGAFRTSLGQLEELEPLDLLLEEPVINEVVETADYDLETGRLNPEGEADKPRRVFIKRGRVPILDQDEDTKFKVHGGEFSPCGVCNQGRKFRISPVQDHLTKGDQPFQTLVSKQLEVQPPNATAKRKFAPLRGRKVLVFSDSRQTAARLAPNLQTYAMRDALRPLIVFGFKKLQQFDILSRLLSLDDLYLAVLVGANQLEVRLRLELKSGESFNAEKIVANNIETAFSSNDNELLQLYTTILKETPPESLLHGINECLTHPYYGLQSVALGSIIEQAPYTSKLKELPDVPGVAMTPDEKLALARIWLGFWQRRAGFWLNHMPSGWWLNEVKSHKGKFEAMKRRMNDKAATRVFNNEWVPKLLEWFTEPPAKDKRRLKGSTLSLEIEGKWAYCQTCRTTQRPFPNSTICLNCGQDSAVLIDPDNDEVFVARKGYYRASTIAALNDPPIAPFTMIAAEHTAQLNVAETDETFSAGEEHELLFQDVDIDRDDNDLGRPAIDVLSCTTTMEVGIDIGSLSGVALRNMPPARSNYQQRAGRAGRRGNSVATVIAFGSADSHDEHYFTHPEEMIKGDVEDPRLTLNNLDITKRHVTAYLLQKYHQHKLPTGPDDQSTASAQLFAVLGTVSDFKRTGTRLNRKDFGEWLRTNAGVLKSDVSAWLPSQLSSDERNKLLGEIVEATLEAIDIAIDYKGEETIPHHATHNGKDSGESLGEIDNVTISEMPAEEGEEIPGRNAASENLLDRLLYKGILPQYAFPTDVATFYVFDQDASAINRPRFQFTPSQGLPVALSQYAPGKDVWVKNKLWHSGAIYSPMAEERHQAWQQRRLYYECNYCGYAETLPLTEGTRGEIRDCGACGHENTVGPARYWLRPPGFAHPVDRPEGTTPDDQPVQSYATRAKLIAPSPANPDDWVKITDRLRLHPMRKHLLVTNRGPKQDGYTYCTTCGRIEPTATIKGTIATAHRKPYPDEREPDCSGERTTKNLMLGTDFITDVLLISIVAESPVTLAPGLLASNVALRTIAEALTKAGSDLLNLEPRELQAEYRPAMTEDGRSGREAEIYVYDTLPGGAGFVRRVGDLGRTVFDTALQLLENCPGDCRRSCYRCLQSYKNKFEHDLLDRHLGAGLLRYILNNEVPVLDSDRLDRATDLLFKDLKRQESPQLITIEKNYNLSPQGLGPVTAPIYLRRKDGAEFVVGVSGPLTPDDTENEALQDLKEYCPSISVLLCDEMVIQRNLPKASGDVLSRIS